jgi:hypothetical protein
MLLRRWKQAKRGTLLGRRSVTNETAAMFKPDRRRQIDAVIDYFGGIHEAQTTTVGRARNGKVFTTDGPFAETKEQIGGGQVMPRMACSSRPRYQAV